MADYISILDKAITGLSENTPENRSIIYSKARAAIEKKLRAMDPMPSEDAIGRQLAQLENAINEVDGKYAPPPEPAVSQPIESPAPEAYATPAEPVVPSTADAPQSLVVPEGFIDDIILIDGIGEKTVSLLADEGVTKISQIAAMSDPDLAALTEKIGFKGFEVTQEWKAQAASMLSGELPRSKTDQARLEKLQEERRSVEQTPVENEPPVTTPTADSAASPSMSEKIQAADPVVGSASGSSQPSPEVTIPSVSEPILNQPVLDNSAPSEPSPISEASSLPSPAAEPEMSQIPEAAAVQASTTPEPVVPAAPEPQTAQSVGMSTTPVTSEPAFVSELEGDPAPSPANDPYLERPVKVAPAKKGGAGKVIATGSILLLLGAAAAGAYFYKDQLIKYGNKGISAVQQLIEPKNEAENAEPPATNTQAADAETPKVEEPKVEEPKTEEAASGAKDTSRLGNDGTVTNEPLEETPASDENTPSAPTEPTSGDDTVTQDPIPIAPAIDESETPATVQVEEESASNEAAQADASTEQAAESVAIQNGEKSFLYEEALGTRGANRDEGSMAWSLANEAPEEGAEPEAVIKGVLEIPTRGLKMNISIKRNLDSALPASHIIELLFTAPSDFSGGNVDGISRFVMKSTEQARGESLVGVPARIDTGYFLIALNNLEQAQQTNLGLLENADWVDIPVTYVTGRRALITFEKGASGKEVFDNALADWKNR